MNDENTNWGQSVAGVVMKDNKVLLTRHTYGNGMLIIPGGYVNVGESPQDALRCDWYIVFAAEYVSGEAVSDHDENSEVVWIEVEQALARDDVPELTKKMIESAVSKSGGLQYTDYAGSPKQALHSLYTLSDFCPEKGESRT